MARRRRYSGSSRGRYSSSEKQSKRYVKSSKAGSQAEREESGASADPALLPGAGEPWFSLQAGGFQFDVLPGSVLLLVLALLWGIVVGYYLWSPLFPAALTVVVLIHELGHGLAARAAGHRVARIVLTPWGGAAVHDAPTSIVSSVAIALAGPGLGLVSAAGAAVLWYLLTAGRWDAAQPSTLFLSLVTVMGVYMNLFNLLPVSFMDGGRALRPVMARWVPSRLGLVFCAFGLAFGVMLMLLGCFTVVPATGNGWLNPNLLLITSGGACVVLNAGEALSRLMGSQ